MNFILCQGYFILWQGGDISFLFHSFPGGYFIAISFFSRGIFHSCIILSQGISHFHFISFSYHSFLGGYIISISFFLRRYFIPISFFPRRIYHFHFIPCQGIYHSCIIPRQGDISFSYHSFTGGYHSLFGVWWDQFQKLDFYLAQFSCLKSDYVILWPQMEINKKLQIIRPTGPQCYKLAKKGKYWAKFGLKLFLETSLLLIIIWHNIFCVTHVTYVTIFYMGHVTPIQKSQKQ
jgi:hypothetical protein